MKSLYIILTTAILFIRFPIAAESEIEQFKTHLKQWMPDINSRMTTDKMTLKSEVTAFTGSNDIRIQIYAKYILALSNASPADNFQITNQLLADIIPVVEKLKAADKSFIIGNFFRIDPIVDIFKITQLNDRLMMQIRDTENFILLEGLSLYFYQLAKIFYLFSVPTEKCGDSPCLNDFFFNLFQNNALIDKYFYSNNQSVKTRSNEMDLWYIDIFKHVPEK